MIRYFVDLLFWMFVERGSNFFGELPSNGGKDDSNTLKPPLSLFFLFFIVFQRLFYRFQELFWNGIGRQIH